MKTTDTFVTIYIEGKGVVSKEKALMALETGSGRILAFGAEAELMAENSTENVGMTAPWADGKITDYKTTVKLFLCMLHKAGVKGSLFHKPSIALSVPEGLTDVEKKALEDALYQAGAGKVSVSEREIGQFVRSLSCSSDKSLKGFQTGIGITKEE